jgi:hypothetical protein
VKAKIDNVKAKIDNVKAKIQDKEEKEPWSRPSLVSHLIFRRKPNASHMCARIKFTHI